MTILIGIALKSLLIAGLTLGLLQLMKQRSAAERSWVAHIGLLALVIMAVAPLALPSWNVEAPALFANTKDAAATPVAAAPAALAVSPSIAPAAAKAAAQSAQPRLAI